MFATLSLASLCLGVSMAGYAPRAGRRTAFYETCGGTLVMGGLVLCGACLPLFR